MYALCYKIMVARLLGSLYNTPKAELGHGLIRKIYSLVVYALKQYIIPSMFVNVTHYVFKTNNLWLD